MHGRIYPPKLAPTSPRRAENGWQASGDPFISLDLCTVHNAPRAGIEGVTPVQHREIVPHQQIADLPFVAHQEARLRCVRPQSIEQRIAIGHLHTNDIAVWAAAQKQSLSPGSRFGAYQRMGRSYRLADVAYLLE